jgi:predicted DNA-binding protein (UPF0251 family)
VILLREVHGLDYEEIAPALAISLGTVRSRLSRARSELRSALSEGRDGWVGASWRGGLEVHRLQRLLRHAAVTELVEREPGRDREQPAR